MIDKNPLTEAELEFLEFFYDPTAMTECLIPKTFNAPQAWNSDCDCIIVRDYQFSMQNYSNMLAPDPTLSDEENFRLRKGAGTCYMIGARDLGKSWWLIIDCVLSIIYGIVEIGVASFTADKLKKVCNSIAAFVESHKFLKMFHLKQENTKRKSVNRDPLTVNTEHGSITYAMNEHINDESKIGVQFHSKHYEVRYYEEYSYATNKGQQKGVDSGTTYGYIDRPSGIPDLCVGSPLGDILQNKKLKNWIWRLPQYVNSAWSNKIEEDKATFYKGKQTPMYKLNVEAEVLEGAFGFFDMPRLKSASFKSGGRVKFLEVHKDTFSKYEDILIVERLPGAKQCFICGDLGFGAAPTELIIVFWDGTKYKFIYNISLLRLTPEEQPEIIKYLYDKLGGAFVALDSTSDSGAMIDRLFKMGIPEDHLLKVRFNENIEIGYEIIVDSNGNEIVQKDNFGNPIMKEHNCEDWSFKELERVMYDGVMEIPPDPKFETQFTNVIATSNKGKIQYGSKGENHEVQAWQVWAICRFFNEFKSMKDQRKKRRCFGVVNIRRDE